MKMIPREGEKHNLQLRCTLLPTTTIYYLAVLVYLQTRKTK